MGKYQACSCSHHQDSSKNKLFSQSAAGVNIVLNDYWQLQLLFTVLWSTIVQCKDPGGI